VSKISFSVITLCYKGKQYLRRLYSSILKQGSKFDVEWIIVDDFSDDNGETRAVIDDIKSISAFPIKVIYLDKNQLGSISAYTGALNASGEYAIILDQDDMLADNALITYSKYISEYQSLPSFAGVCGRCVGTDGRFIGTPFPWNERLSNELVIRHEAKIRGEMHQCTKTKLIVEYFYGMKPGYTNGWAWSRMAKKYDYLYTSKIVRVYDTENPGSISRSKPLICLEAQFEQLSEYLVSNADYLVKDYVSCLRMMTQWARFGLHLKKGRCELIDSLTQSNRWLFYFAFSLAVFKVKRDRMKGVI
jgi:glycosyltransferase involved in cell wall biosynthesis